MKLISFNTLDGENMSLSPQFTLCILNFRNGNYHELIQVKTMN